MSRLGKTWPQLQAMGCAAAICASRPPPPSRGSATEGGFAADVAAPPGRLTSGSAWPPPTRARSGGGGRGGIIRAEGEGVGDDESGPAGVNDRREHVRAIMGNERKGEASEGRVDN